MKRLIQNTTRQERIDIINELYHCHNGDCENCGICKIFVGTSPLEVFEPYIEGYQELNEVSMEFNQKRMKSLFK
ncbi:MAG: hypothetical protein U0L85_09985 [Bacilli bacterium]|nr:hypothetical protein [Bacilli bacterium]